MDLNEYLKIIRVHQKKIILTTLSVLAIVVFFSLIQRPSYQATTVLEYQETNAINDFIGQLNLPTQLNQPERQLSTQAELIMSKPLASKIISKLKLNITPEIFLKKISVDFEEKANLIKITAEDGNPKQAQLIANTLAKTFLEASNNSASAEISKAKNEISFKMKDIQEDIQLYSHLINTANNAAPSTPDSNSEDIKSQIAVARNIYTDLAGKYQQLKILEDLSTGGLKLAIPATMPRRPSTPDLPKNIFIALILGLASSITWVFTNEYLDNTIKNNEDIEKYFSLPLLGQIPLTDTGNDNHNKKEQSVGREAKLVNHNSYAAEAYRAVRTNIQFLNFDNQMKTIIVTSPTAGDGKTTISANLASALALSGGKILLIDCDLRHPQVHKVLKLENLVGLSSLLIKSNYLDEAIRKTRVPEFSVITSGPLPPNPSELLGSNRMTKLLESVKEEYDYIIIDTPPVCAVTDAAVLAQKVDGVILVCSFNSTLREAAMESRKIFDNVKSRLLGVVGNKLDAKGRYGYYSKYYGHYYSYDQQSEDNQNQEQKAS